MRLPAFALLLASLGAIAALALAAEHLRPPLVPLAGLGAWEGRAVAVEALVARAHPAGPGAMVLALADGTGAATAFWGQAQPLEGARVRAEGAVERSRGQWELRAWRVEVLAHPGQPLAPSQAARLAPALAGQEVAVLGTLRWDGGWGLEEPGTRLPLRAPAGAEALAGARVLAAGVLRYEPEHAGYALHAREARAA